MALPALEKTWQFNVNGWTGTSRADALYELKEALIGFSSNPWTVVRSCNGSTVSASDLWLSGSNVVFDFSGNAHSWIVLEQPAIGTGFQILLEARKAGGGNPSEAYFYVSTSAGFTGGSTTAPATATDQTDCGVASVWDYNGADAGRLHVMMSDDGLSTRWMYSYSGRIPHLVIVERPRTPIAPWTTPWVFMEGGISYTTTAQDGPTYSSLNAAANTFGRIGTGNVSFYLTSEMYGSGMSGQNITVPDDQTGEWPMFPIGLACGTAGHKGVRKGSMYDLWWGSTAVATGATYPDNVSFQFVQVGDLILPWSGEAPLF